MLWHASHVHSARAVDGWHVPRPINALPWKRHRRCTRYATSTRCAALERQASFKGTALSRLKECKDDQYPFAPLFFHYPRQPAEYLLVSTLAFVISYVCYSTQIDCWSRKSIKRVYFFPFVYCFKENNKFPRRF